MKITLIAALLLLITQAFAAKIEVDVAGMTCAMCVESITRELKATEKVESISVNLETKKASFVEVKGEKMSDSEIKSAIKKAGYEGLKIRRY